MQFQALILAFFLLCSAGLIALAVMRHETSRLTVAEQFGWMAILLGLAQPVAAWLVHAYGLQIDINSFAGFELMAAFCLTAAIALPPFPARQHILLSTGAVALLAASAQYAYASVPAINGALIAAAMLTVTYLCVALEAYGSARTAVESRKILTAIAVIGGVTSAVLLINAILLLSPLTSQMPRQWMLEAVSILWLVLKLLMLAELLQLFSVRRAEGADRIARALVQKANDKHASLRIAALALYQSPGMLLIATAAGKLAFANADARKFLAFPDLDKQTLENLFITVQPAVHGKLRAVFKRPDKYIVILQISLMPLECDQQRLHAMRLEVLPFEFSELRDLLIEARADAAHEMTGLLDQHFSIISMSDAWATLLGPMDRYANSGLLWDKLRILSTDGAEISHLENSLASKDEATAWLRLHEGRGISVMLEKLHTPDQRHFFMIRVIFIDADGAAA